MVVSARGTRDEEQLRGGAGGRQWECEGGRGGSSCSNAAVLGWAQLRLQQSEHEPPGRRSGVLPRQPCHWAAAPLQYRQQAGARIHCLLPASPGNDVHRCSVSQRWGCGLGRLSGAAASSTRLLAAHMALLALAITLRDMSQTRGHLPFSALSKPWANCWIKMRPEHAAMSACLWFLLSGGGLLAGSTSYLVHSPILIRQLRVCVYQC